MLLQYVKENGCGEGIGSVIKREVEMPVPTTQKIFLGKLLNESTARDVACAKGTAGNVIVSQYHWIVPMVKTEKITVIQLFTCRS